LAARARGLTHEPLPNGRAKGQIRVRCSDFLSKRISQTIAAIRSSKSDNTPEEVLGKELLSEFPIVWLERVLRWQECSTQAYLATDSSRHSKEFVNFMRL
jgi:hypothetical protein